MKNSTSGIESNRASTSAASTASGLCFTGAGGPAAGHDILVGCGARPPPVRPGPRGRDPLHATARARPPCPGSMRVAAASDSRLPSFGFPQLRAAVGDVIEVLPGRSGGAGAQLRLRPPRALTGGQFRARFAALAGAMWLAAGLGWLAGNVFAPAFALLHSAGVALALRMLWSNGERGEEIAIGPRAVEVRRGAETVFSAHPYWVRLQVAPEDGMVMLSSGGRDVEVGAFLGPGERRQLARCLREFLAAASGRNR